MDFFDISRVVMGIFLIFAGLGILIANMRLKADANGPAEFVVAGHKISAPTGFLIMVLGIGLWQMPVILAMLKPAPPDETQAVSSRTQSAAPATPSSSSISTNPPTPNTKITGVSIESKIGLRAGKYQGDYTCRGATAKMTLVVDESKSAGILSFTRSGDAGPEKASYAVDIRVKGKQVLIIPGVWILEPDNGEYRPLGATLSKIEEIPETWRGSITGNIGFRCGDMTIQR